ncbi:hypothetical protein ONZ45_g5790 [Pleurotus djamor]|nr:hypothetical protein ONZ45_g5790 [Pleurotus djamor]
MQERLERAFGVGSDGGGDGDSDSGQDQMADALGKILALVKQVRLSPQARAYFQKCCRLTGTPPATLITWVRTRWASLHAFLTRVLALKDAVNQFVNTADDSDEVPNLRNKYYADFRLSRKDWERLS